jgi:hypothetical protein
MRPAARGALIEGGVWLALAGGAWWLTYGFDEPLIVYRLGAAAWPRALILLIAGVALCQVAARLGWLGARRAGQGEPGGAGTGEAHARGVLLKRAATFALPLVYLLLLPRAGYYAVTPFFVSGYMYLLGERRLRHLAGTALFIYALVLLAFTRVFFVPLPTGVWPGFYEFSHWFLSLIQ